MPPRGATRRSRGSAPGSGPRGAMRSARSDSRTERRRPRRTGPSRTRLRPPRRPAPSARALSAADGSVRTKARRVRPTIRARRSRASRGTRDRTLDADGDAAPRPARGPARAVVGLDTDAAALPEPSPGRRSTYTKWSRSRSGRFSSPASIAPRLFALVTTHTSAREASIRANAQPAPGSDPPPLARTRTRTRGRARSIPERGREPPTSSRPRDSFGVRARIRGVVQLR